MPGSCGRSGHHRYFLAGDAPRMHQILSINQRVESDQTGISIECRSRWLRAPATTETDIPVMGVSVFVFPCLFPVHSRMAPRSPCSAASISPCP